MFFLINTIFARDSKSLGIEERKNQERIRIINKSILVEIDFQLKFYVIENIEKNEEFTLNF